MNKSRYRLLSVSWILGLLLSCTNTAHYDLYQTIENPWPKDREYYFTYEIEDHTVPYNISLEIRNNNFYPYQNLWLLCAEERPVGAMVRDTVECVLADDYGRWKGRGISVYHNTIPLRISHLFPHKGQYTLCIRQGMRDERLKGIEAIGLRIEKTAR